MKNVSAVFLLLLVNLPVLAVDISPINIVNNTGKDVAYIMSAPGLNAIYGILSGEMSAYHPKSWDEFSTVEVGLCKLIEDDVCVEVESLSNCVNNARYNAYHIKSIQINSITSCTVKCADGSATSCRQAG